MAHAAFTRTFCHHSTKWMALSASAAFLESEGENNQFLRSPDSSVREANFQYSRAIRFHLKMKMLSLAFPAIGAEKKNEEWTTDGANWERKCAKMHFFIFSPRSMGEFLWRCWHCQDLEFFAPDKALAIYHLIRARWGHYFLLAQFLRHFSIRTLGFPGYEVKSFSFTSRWFFSPFPSWKQPLFQNLSHFSRTSFHYDYFLWEERTLWWSSILS